MHQVEAGGGGILCWEVMQKAELGKGERAKRWEKPVIKQTGVHLETCWPPHSLEPGQGELEVRFVAEVVNLARRRKGTRKFYG